MSIDNFNKVIDASSKLAVPIGVAIMLWLQSQFVTRLEFATSTERVDQRLSKIETVLIRMEAGAEMDKRHDAVLLDHENRIRSLERGK